MARRLICEMSSRSSAWRSVCSFEFVNFTCPCPPVFCTYIFSSKISYCAGHEVVFVYLLVLCFPAVWLFSRFECLFLFFLVDFIKYCRRQAIWFAYKMGPTSRKLKNLFCRESVCFSFGVRKSKTCKLIYYLYIIILGLTKGNIRST